LFSKACQWIVLNRIYLSIYILFCRGRSNINKDWDPTTYWCMFQATICISSVICDGIFYIQWVEIGCNFSFCWYGWLIINHLIYLGCLLLLLPSIDHFQQVEDYVRAARGNWQMLKLVTGFICHTLIEETTVLNVSDQRLIIMGWWYRDPCPFAKRIYIVFIIHCTHSSCFILWCVTTVS
jgi:hypothetical protein